MSNFDKRVFYGGRQTGKTYLNNLYAKAIFNSDIEPDWMSFHAELMDYQKRVYIPIEDSPVSDITEVLKLAKGKVNYRLVSNQLNLLVIENDSIKYRFVVNLLHKAIQYYYSDALFRYIEEADRNALGYLRRFKF